MLTFRFYLVDLTTIINILNSYIKLYYVENASNLGGSHVYKILKFQNKNEI